MFYPPFSSQHETFQHALRASPLPKRIPQTIYLKQYLTPQALAV